ncbi:hypothetical protein ZWY2020_038705 [Hordeum vulgare]|nr:hypothetical protein ZWY2020_038705 [Hordeum vulgare]
MDMSAIAALLGLSGSGSVVRMAAELRRLCDINFDSSVLGIVSIPHGPLNYLLSLDPSVVLMNDAASSCRKTLDLDVREWGNQFGCVRLIPLVQKGLVLYKERFLAALPPWRSNTDFGRPVFTAAAFYLCAKRHKLKVDKLKLIDLCGTSSSEFTTVMGLELPDVALEVAN